MYRVRIQRLQMLFYICFHTALGLVLFDLEKESS
jgi:hypothetical protein